MPEYDANQYTIPSERIIRELSDTPGLSVQEALRVALEVAGETKTLDATNFDQTRIEFGAAGTRLAEQPIPIATPVPTPENHGDFTSPAHLLQIGKRVNIFRSDAIDNGKAV